MADASTSFSLRPSPWPRETSGRWRPIRTMLHLPGLTGRGCLSHVPRLWLQCSWQAGRATNAVVHQIAMALRETLLVANVRLSGKDHQMEDVFYADGCAR